MKEVKNIKQICIRRRKVFVVMLVLVFILAQIFVFFNREYRYAGRKSKWKKTSIIYTEGEPVMGEYIQYFDDVLSSCKDAINNTQELREQYPFLNWQNFEQVKIGICEKIILPDGTSVHDGMFAKYYAPDNTVLIMKSYINKLEGFFAMRVIIYELMHCLICSTGLSGVMYEGIAEILCQQVCERNNIEFTFNETYKYDIWVVQMLENVLGRQKLVYLTYYNILNDVIDKYTRDNYGKMLIATLENLSEYSKNQKRLRTKFAYEMESNIMIRIIQDILVHFTYNYCEENFCLENKDEIINDCKNELLLKENYFVNLIGDEET